MKTRTYRVVWEIDIDAKSPKDAAKEALRIQRDKTDATCFSVYNSKGRRTDVDLEAEPPEAEITEDWE